MNSTKEAELEWHDRYYKAHARDCYPPTLAEFEQRFKRTELTDFCEGGWSWWADLRREAIEAIGSVQGLRVLDYGCGFGSLGMYLSLRRARVWGFDLSGEATKVAGDAARRYGLSAQFAQMDAEDLRYEDNFFDLVVGFGVLHHVIKYPAAASHLYRVLKAGGRAIFIESLWDNPLINLARRFTTAEADAGDARLTEAGIYEFCGSFRDIRVEKRNLLYMLKRLASLPERGLSAPVRPRPFWRWVKSVDSNLLRFGPLRRYCGEVIIYLSK
jgi:SAM-dependent methyltransferase